MRKVVQVTGTAIRVTVTEEGYALTDVEPQPGDYLLVPVDKLVDVPDDFTAGMAVELDELGGL